MEFINATALLKANQQFQRRQKILLWQQWVINIGGSLGVDHGWFKLGVGRRRIQVAEAHAKILAYLPSLDSSLGVFWDLYQQKDQGNPLETRQPTVKEKKSPRPSGCPSQTMQYPLCKAKKSLIQLNSTIIIKWHM